MWRVTNLSLEEQKGKGVAIKYSDNASKMDKKVRS
jgi:hypothetical protein